VEKIRTFKASSDGWHHVDAYRAADVDALLADVRRLVEAAKTARTFLRSFGQHKLADRVDQTIAAVERHLATSPPHSSPPPADTGRA